MLRIIQSLQSPIIPSQIKMLFGVVVFLTLIYAVWLMIKLKAPIWMIWLLPGWAVISTVIARSGQLIDQDQIKPLFMLIPVAPIILMALTIARGRLDMRLRQLPQAYFILPQAMRIVVEVVLVQLFWANIVPVQMTFEGFNFDILSGLGGLLLGAFLMMKPSAIPHAAIRVYNYIGLALLLTILTIAVLSAPLPIRQFHNSPANTMIAFFPMILLPAIVVVWAAVLHLLSLRKLKLEA